MVFYYNPAKLVTGLEFSRREVNVTSNKPFFRFEQNPYITNHQIYGKILADLIFLENVFRDSYVKEVFFIKNDVEQIDNKQEKRNQNILTKIEYLYFYYFMYQLYADYRYWLDDKKAYNNELKRFNANVSDNHYGYFSMLKRCFIQAFGAIKQFDGTNDNTFLDVEKMEKEIGITKEHAIQSVEGKDRYMLYYLQPSGFTGKSRSVRVTRRDGENSGDVVDKKGYKLKRRNSSKKQAKIIINKYKEQLEMGNKVNVTKFAKENNISRTMFYDYLKKYNK